VGETVGEAGEEGGVAEDLWGKGGELVGGFLEYWGKRGGGGRGEGRAR